MARSYGANASLLLKRETAYGKRLGIEETTITRTHRAMVEALFSRSARLEVTVV